jgi:L-threonylcarbamoyladenylate synthase
MPREPHGYAQRLYAALRELDDAQCESILIEAPPETPEWAGVRDRLMRATT